MDILTPDLQNIIFKYIHQMKFREVINELNNISDIWCFIYLERRYAINKDIAFYNKAKATFNNLNDYEQPLMRYYRFYDIDFLHYQPKIIGLSRHYL